MKFYHGTTERNARGIEGDGFLGSEISEFTDGFSHVEGGVVYLATSPDHAAGYGEVVFEIDTDDAFLFGECPVTGLPEYAVEADRLNRDGNFQRIISKG